ncbi:hypothetical protein D3C81_1523020 [compost metagenome]
MSLNISTKLPDRRVVKNMLNLDLIPMFEQPGDELNCLYGVAAELEEMIRNADGTYAKQAFPNVREDPLHFALRRSELTFTDSLRRYG